MIAKEQLSDTPGISIAELVTEAMERMLVRFAQTLGKPVDEARDIFVKAEATLFKLDPRQEIRFLNEEVRVIPLADWLSGELKEDQNPLQIRIAPDLLVEKAREIGIRMNRDRLFTALGRHLAKRALAYS